MLTLSRQRGISLVETLVAVTIIGVVMALAAPSFSTWMSGTRIRSTAESLIAGLHYARSEATTRNTQVRFQLTTSIDNTCERSMTSANFVVDVVDADPGQDSVEKRCNTPPSDTAAPSILQVRAARETGTSTTVVADANQVLFNGLGRLAPVAPAAAADTVTIDIAPVSSAGRCVLDGGKVTCLRIVVSPAGQVRMCNPSIAAGDPQAC